MTVENTRTLSLHERFCLARAQAGSPPVICILGKLALPLDQSLKKSIRNRIKFLMCTYPLLGAAVVNNYSREPRWERQTAHVDVDFILQVEENVGDAAGTFSLEDILGMELAKAETIPLDTAALWCVTLYSSSSEPDTTYLALVVAHVIVDGRGALALFSELLSEKPEDAPSSKRKPSTAGSTSDIALPPRCEDTVHYHPRWLPLAQTVVQELLLPLLPSFVRDRLREKPAWPAHQPLPVKPKRCRMQLFALDFTTPGEEPQEEEDVVAGLKLFAQKTGTGTVNSLLHTACLAALLTITRSESKTERKRTGLSLRLATETAMSLRDETKGHPLTTGNYVGAATATYEDDELLRETVWRTASKYHQDLHSTTGRKDAIGRMGMLRYIPDPAMPADRKFKTEGAQVFPCPTGWEQFWINKEESSTPYRGSLGLSNLGVMPSPPLRSKGKLQAALEKVWFAQLPSPSGDALIVDAVSCKVSSRTSSSSGSAYLSTDKNTAPQEQTRLSIVVGWREGVLEETLVTKFCSALKSALLDFARAGREEEDGNGTIDRETTMMDFCALL